MKKRNSSNVNAKVKVLGYNLNNLINICVENGIKLIDVKKSSPCEMEFYINDADLKKFKTINTQNYEISLITPSLSQRILHFLKYRIGLIVGLIASFVLILTMQNRLISIQVFGTSNVDKSQVVQKINEFGLTKFSYMNFDKSSLEKYLSDELKLSFVSIMTKGNSLIVNVKEELPDINNSYLPIVAEYDMVINSINVYSGTAVKSSGDIVFKGDIIVEPYNIVSGEKLEISPCAEIVADVYFSEKYEFQNQETRVFQTGKAQVISVDYKLGNINLFSKKFECKFENYELQKSCTLLSEYFLPLKMNKIIAYETFCETVDLDFESSKEQIVDNLKEKVYKKVPDNLKVESENVKISSTNYGNIVTIYLKSSVYLKYGK